VDASYIDQPSGNGSLSAPVARMTAARFALADDAPAGGEHVEYQVRAIDQAGQTSQATETVEATATETPAPAPTALNVAQTSDADPVQLTWDDAPGADRYAVYRALDADADVLQNNGQTSGAAELIADVPATVTDYNDKPEVSGRYTYSVRSVSSAGQLGETGPATTADLQATKVPPSQELLDHARDIEAMLDDGGAPGRERIPCTTKCKALRAGERALEKLGPTADKVRSQLYKLRAGGGVLPRLALLSSLPADAALGSGYLGWTIGTALRKAYFTEELPQAVPGVPEIHGRKLVYANDVAATWACAPDWWNSACIGNGGTAIIGHLHAPGSMIAVGTNAGGGQILFESWKNDCSSDPAPEPQAQLPGGWQWLTDIGPCPVWWAGKDKHWVPYRRATLSTPVSAPDDRGITGTTVPTETPAPSEARAIDRLIEQLQYNSDQYGALISWLERQLGNDSTPTTPDGTPSCTSMTYEACVSAFEHAGFAGPFTKKVVEFDETWIGEPGGAVVGTTPWADDQPDDDGPVEIEVNPDQMPEWTQQDEQIDQNIKNINPISDNEFLVETLRKNIARRCRIRSFKAGLPANLCWTLPILITGGADARGPAVNDLQALVRHARWLGPNRRPKELRNGQAWYYNQPGPGAGCLQSEKPNTTPGCDEYPMWDWSQAKGGSLETETPNIAWVPQLENGRQGRVWQHVKDMSPVGGATLRFRGCNIPITPKDPPVEMPLRDGVAPTFLAIPVPARLMLSFGICNSAVSG
jgi:hypothetical protein